MHWLKKKKKTTEEPEMRKKGKHQDLAAP